MRKFTSILAPVAALAAAWIVSGAPGHNPGATLIEFVANTIGF